MKSSVLTILPTWVVLAAVCTAQTVMPQHGTTNAPADGALIAPGDNFPFNFTPVPYGTNACFPAYDGIAVYLSTVSPTAGDVTSDETSRCVLTNGSFVADLGRYVVPHFGGLPPVGPGFPPATLPMPFLDVADGTTLFLSVIEHLGDCLSLEYFCGIETTTVVYA